MRKYSPRERRDTNPGLTAIRTREVTKRSLAAKGAYSSDHNKLTLTRQLLFVSAVTATQLGWTFLGGVGGGVVLSTQL